MHLSAYSRVNETNTSFVSFIDAETCVDVVYLILVALTGVFGNLLVICSIIHGKKTFRNGNVFIINLAVADLVVSETTNY